MEFSFRVMLSTAPPQIAVARRPLPIGRVEAKSAAGLVYQVYVEGLNEMAIVGERAARTASAGVSHILLLFTDTLE